MKKFERIAAQGDLLIRKIDVGAVPTGAAPLRAQHRDGFIVAHSETGHHHVLEAAPGVAVLAEGAVLYATVPDRAVLTHHRSFDTHEALELPAGTFELRRAKEYTPRGWRRVVD